MEEERESSISLTPETRNNVEACHYYLQQMYRRLQPRLIQVFGTSVSIVNEHLNELRKLPAGAQQSDLCILCSNHKCELIETGGDWIQCDLCKEWLHQQCDGIYNALLAEKIHYTCPRCRVIFCRPHPGIQYPQLLHDPAALQVTEVVLDNKRKLSRDKKMIAGKKSSSRRRTKGEDSESSAENVKASTIDVPPVEEIHVARKTDTFVFQIPVAEYYPRTQRDGQTGGRRSKQGKETSMTPQVIDSYVNAAFNSLRIGNSTPYTTVQDLYLAAQVADPDLPSLPLGKLKNTLISDTVHPGNFASLFLNCFYELTKSGRAVVQSPDSTRSENSRREELITGLLETLLPANQIFYTTLFPILPMDHDLRINVAISIFDNLLLSLERQRFRYLRMLIPVALNCLLVFYKTTLLPGEGEPKWSFPADTDAIIERVVERLQQCDLTDVELSLSSYLPWEKLLCEPNEIDINSNEVPDLLTKRQWYDLKMRGVLPFKNVGIVRAALLHAIVNANLGIIVLDKAFGREVTDHLIRFGVSSGRAMIVSYASNSSFDAMLETGCVYETTSFRPASNLATIQDALKDDESIMDWDVLETPTSVVWALSFIGDELQRLEDAKVIEPSTFV
ncbi:PHD zinc finger domain-containing protein [Giardia duodenalis]|uniref:PHD zinc finger domain-containing protein n=1 Tax=Giardia intestinalis (strain ATCC 50803 / WB clone C6) TaxID=184922 RepID=A8BKX2_GIAIC|nr:PHD zinc finger domain-containing protein [Giardia intestinalis]KAE8301616.1 PHD zinc finger domain-containing protein [Giardia intestinalis]|eukprot:XP_001706368.1 Hypothetical protein GL50803_8381 [Giardia lamblia ATCC 50803]